MASAKERFQQLAQQEEAEKKKREEEERKKEEERRRKAAGGQTHIGTTKGQIKAFATGLFQSSPFSCLCLASLLGTHPAMALFSLRGGR